MVNYRVAVQFKFQNFSVFTSQISVWIRIKKIELSTDTLVDYTKHIGLRYSISNIAQDAGDK